MGDQYEGMSREDLVAELEEKNRLIADLKAYKHWHKKIQDTLQKKEKLLRAVFESSTDVVIVWDRSYRFLYANQAAGSLAGSTSEPLVGKTIQDALGRLPEFMDLWKTRIDHVIATGEPMRVNDVMPLGNRLVYSESTLSPVKNADGTIYAVAVVYRDVTEHRRMQRRVSETLALNEKIFEASSFGIIAYQSSGQAVLANEASAEILGCPRERLLQQNFNRLDSWKKTGLAVEARQVLEDGEQRRMEMHTLLPSGREIWLDCRLYRFSAGQDQHVLLVFEDIASQRRVQDLYTRLLDFSRAGVYRYAFDDGRILFANQGLVDILDLKCEPGDLNGTCLKDLMVYVEKEASIRTLLDEHGEIHNYEYHFKTLDGDDRWVIHDSFLSRDPRTGKKIVESIVKDITGRKRMERRLLHVDAVLRAMNSINQIIVSEKNRDRLLGMACECLAEIPSYHGAWAAVWDSRGNTVTARSGEVAGVLELAGTPGGQRCCIARALDYDRVTMIDAPAEGCSGCPAADALSSRGEMFARLEHGDRVFGLLAVFLDRELLQEPEEQELFHELVGDIGLALHDIELEQQRARAEVALKQAKEKAQTYLDIAGVILVALDTRGTVTLINKKGCEILGYPEEDIIGRNWFESFLPERFRPSVRDVAEQLVAGGEEPVAYYENPVLTESGEERLIAWHNTVLQDRDGNVIGHFSSGEDITERRTSEDQIIRQTALLEGINTILLEAFLCDSDEALAHRCLAVAEEMTRSAFGLICEINKKGLFDILAVSETGWEASGISRDEAAHILDNRKITGIRGRVVKTGAPVLTNDPPSHPEWAGIPDGHPEIRRFIGVPLKQGGKTVGIIGLANKQEDYEPDDCGKVEALAVAFMAALQQKRSSAALRESEERYSSLYSSMNEGVALHEVLYDAAGTAFDYRIVDVNPAYEAILGLPRKDVVGRLGSAAYGTGEAPFLEEYARVAARGEPVAFQRYFAPLGRHFRISAFSPRHGFFATIFSDITESKRAEEAMAHQRATVSGINKVLQETLTCDTDEEVARMCLVVAEDLTGSEFGVIAEIGEGGDFDIIALSDPAWEGAPGRETSAAVMVKMMKSIELHSLWERVVLAGDSLVVDASAVDTQYRELLEHAPGMFSFLLVPLQYEEQSFGVILLANKRPGYDEQDPESIEALSVSFVEALYRKRYESALLESEERFQLVARATNDAVWDWDLQTNRLRWNDALHVLFKYRESDVGPDMQWRENNIHPDDRERVVSRLRRSIALGQTTWADEYRFRRSNGSYASVLDRGFILYNSDGQPARMIGSVMDMTELKRAQEALKQTVVELERSNTELEQFAYIASHDLQEPLRKVTVFGDRLNSRCGEALDKKGRNYLERMQSAALRMKHLIRSLLQYSRVTTRAQPFAPVSLEDVVQEVISDLEVKIDESGARIEVGDLPLVAADRVQMHQLFQNLILNALKFRRKDKEPHIIVTSLPAENGLCDILVEDDGIGFLMTYKDRIFKPFQRLHHRHEFEGVGMGLAICDKIVQRHGGRIGVMSEPGKGTTFTVALPVG